VRRNQEILDEAARSIRRTFLGSAAGSLGMLSVVGGVGAYGMPEAIDAERLSVALTSMHATIQPAVERAVPTVERAVALAGEFTRRMPAVLSSPEEVVVLPVPPPLVPPPIASYAAPEPLPAGEATQIDPQPSEPVREDASPADSTASIPAAAEFTAAAGFTLASVTATPVLPAQPPSAEASEFAAIPSPELLLDPDPADAPPVEPAAPAHGSAVEQSPIAVAIPQSTSIELPRPRAPLSPVQRLGLTGKDYEKAERCLAQAIYFEARNQSLRGQMAVAQVVLNRVFSPYYPNDVCSVVYQNAHRRLSCQFTFACDGHPEAIRERGAWSRAQRIARQSLHAEIWLPEVGKATHYHAAYVRPYWVREMNVMVRFGLHTFYRPRQWGDGSKEPSWGAAASRKGQSS
jgi:hypothetical protein